MENETIGDVNQRTAGATRQAGGAIRWNRTWYGRGSSRAHPNTSAGRAQRCGKSSDFRSNITVAPWPRTLQHRCGYWFVDRTPV